MTVTRRIRSPGRARNKPLKPLRAGMPGDLGATCGDYARVLCFTFAREAAGALGTRHSPRPLIFRAAASRKTRAHRVARMRSCVCKQNLQPSSPAQAGDPVSRDVSDGFEMPRRTGYPACAGYDGPLWSSASPPLPTKNWLLRRFALRNDDRSGPGLNSPCVPVRRNDAPSWRGGALPVAPATGSSAWRRPCLSGFAEARPSG
jgi:hypothetical protein